MQWALDFYEAYTWVAGLAFLALAALVWRTRPDRVQNRWLVAVLCYEAVLALVGPALAVTTSARVAYVAGSIFVAALVFGFPVYLGFLSTLQGTIPAFLRTRPMRILPWLLTAFGLTVLAVRPDQMVGNPDPTATDTWATVGGPVFMAFQSVALLMFIVGLVAAVGNWRAHEVGTMDRRRGAVFALGYGIHDAGMFVAIGLSVLARSGGWGDHPVAWSISYYGLPTVKLAMLLLLSYGILYAQLFDIEIKVKRTLGRATGLLLMGAAFAAGKETLEFFLPGEGLVASLTGAAATGAVAWPAWRLGQRLAERVFPQVDAPGHLDARRLEVYRASYESVAADGISQRERRILETVRAQLGLSLADAQRVEDAVQAALALQPPTGTPRDAAVAG